MDDKKKSTGLEQPKLPPATRLNKLAVIVAAAVMSVTLLVVTLMIGRSSEQDVQEKAQREERSRIRRAPARADFMDRPPVEAPLQDGFAEEAFLEDEFLAGTDPALGSYTGLSDPSDAYVPPELYEPAPYYSAPAYGEQSTPQKSSEEQALERAMRSSLVPQGFGGTAARQGQPSDQQADEYQDDDFLSTLAQVQQALGMEGQGVIAPLTGAPTASGQMEPPARPPSPPGNDDFLQRVAQDRQRSGPYIATQIEQPSSRFAVREGTLVEAFLITGIHSDLPGEVVAQVS